MTISHSNLLAMVGDCYALCDHSIFTEWEEKFIASLADGIIKYGDSFTLSERQAEKLKELYAKAEEHLS